MLKMSFMTKLNTTYLLNRAPFVLVSRLLSDYRRAHFYPSDEGSLEYRIAFILSKSSWIRNCGLSSLVFLTMSIDKSCSGLSNREKSTFSDIRS